MKKFLSLCMVVLVILSLAACGIKDVNDTPQESQEPDPAVVDTTGSGLAKLPKPIEGDSAIKAEHNPVYVITSPSNDETGDGDTEPVATEPDEADASEPEYVVDEDGRELLVVTPVDDGISRETGSGTYDVASGDFGISGGSVTIDENFISSSSDNSVNIIGSDAE